MANLAPELVARAAADPALWDRLQRIYRETRTIAVVGASQDPRKAGHRIPAYLHSQGYRIIPVNPRGGELFGETVRPSLAEIDEPIDLVDVFRPSAETPQIARDAVAAGARVLWLQLGIENDEARRIAEDAGLTVVMNRCMGATHRWLGLGPGPD
jgi:predicted CoA-binding protein